MKPCGMGLSYVHLSVFPKAHSMSYPIWIRFWNMVEQVNSKCYPEKVKLCGTMQGSVFFILSIVHSRKQQLYYSWVKENVVVNPDGRSGGGEQFQDDVFVHVSVRQVPMTCPIKHLLMTVLGNRLMLALLTYWSRAKNTPRQTQIIQWHTHWFSQCNS